MVPFQSGGSSQGGFNSNTIIPVILSATHNQGQGGRPQTTQLRPVSSGGGGSYAGSSSSGNDNNLIPLVISATLQQHSNKFNGQGGQSQGHSGSFSQSNSHTQAILPVILSQSQGHGHSHGQSQASSQSSGQNNVIPIVLSSVGPATQQHGKGSGSFGGGYSKNQIDNAFEFSQPQKSREVSSFTVKSQQHQSSQHSQNAGQHPGGPYP